MNIKYKTIRQVRITASISERGLVFTWIIKNNYRITRAGPKMIGPGLADTTKLLVMAEKEI